MREPQDNLRDGFAHYHFDVKPNHPVEDMQEQKQKQEAEFQSATLAKMYGTHFPQRLKMEQYMVSQVQRLPGFKSEFVGLEILLGKNNDIDFEDYLGDPELEETEEVDFHANLEEKMGWAKQSRFA
eukprot:TRINITY_DN1257_c0_g1_i2.p1 TRINITY_DN1257_c0_g1~~TRINITY_DN1257_c0_g1_i2.p1  ORF type:complete len:126 (-),score=44.18 TRINITY_DN1257_c0_g1_i2:125-502(-)